MTKRNTEAVHDGFRFDLIPPGAAVLCALSGGADSMYLLDRLLEGAERGGYTVRAAHYNHQLRPTARRDEDFVREWCKTKGVPLTVGRGDVRGFGLREGLSTEEAARVLRYAFLEQTAQAEGCALIATAHHAGDNAETVLMNLIRGSGLAGLAGIPERRGNIVRPMLAVSRPEIEAYLAACGVPHMEDETNGDDTYTRNKVRHQLIPLLEELNPRAADHIAAAALRLREDEAELSRQAAELARLAERRPDGVLFPAALLANVPRPISLRVIGQLLGQAGLSGQAIHREGVLALAAGDNPSARLDVPGGTVRREYDRLVFIPAREARPLQKERPLAEGVNDWSGWRISCERAVCPETPGTPDSFYLALGEYTIRTRRPGDGLRPPNRSYKTLKKWMIEQRIPSHFRSSVPVLALDGRAVAAGGVGVDAGALALPGQPCWHIMIDKGERE